MAGGHAWGCLLHACPREKTCCLLSFPIFQPFQMKKAPIYQPLVQVPQESIASVA